MNSPIAPAPAAAPPDAPMGGLAADFAHAIGLDQAVRSAMDLPTLHDVPGDEAPTRETSPELEAIKARLAARGLLATRSQIIVPKEPRPEAAVATTTTFTTDLHDDVESELDQWDVEPGREEAPVRCPQCRDMFIRPLEATRFFCPACERGWRWATCTSCDALSFPLERQESWRCGCGAFNRSWWRTASARRDAIHVVARRKHAAVEQARKEVREGMRRRRWKLIALAVWAAVIAVALPIGVRMAQDDGGGTTATCAHWMRLRPAIANGTIVGRELDAEIDGLVDLAASADGAVQIAATGLAAAPVGSAAFLAARAELSNACEAL